MPHREDITGSPTAGHALPTPGEGTAPPPNGDDVKLPLSISPIGGGIGILVDADGVPVVGDDGLPILRNMDTPAGGGAGRTQFASERERDVAGAELARAQAGALVTPEERAARLKFEADQAEIDRELRLRESRLSTARDLVGIRSAEAREARRQGTELAGADPFRFLAVARGLQPPTGTTPSAAFKQNLLGAAQFQDPNLAGLDSNALQSVINKLSGGGVPTGGTLGLASPTTPTQGPFSFAHGGVVNAGGATPTGGSQAISVGERGPEIMILRPDGSVEVVPMAGSAQEGGVFDLGGFGPLFGRLRESIGAPATTLGTPKDRLRAISPSLRSQFGFLPLNVEQETDAPFQAFAGPLSNIFQGQFEALENQFLNAGLAPAQARSRAQSEASLLSRQVGSLPAPHKIPPTFFSSLLPAEQTALISAYRFAGTPEDDFRHLLTAPLLSATPTPATAIG